MGFFSLENSRLGRHLTQMIISVLGLSELFVIEVPFTEQPVLMTYIISNTHPHLCILKLPENFRVNQS